MKCPLSYIPAAVGITAYSATILKKHPLKREVKGNYLNIIKIIYCVSTAIVILAGKVLKLFHSKSGTVHIERSIKYIFQVFFLL